MNLLKKYLFPISIFTFYIAQIQGLYPSVGRRIIWELIVILASSLYFLVNPIHKAAMGYCVFLSLFRGSALSFAYLVTIWCGFMFCSMVYRAKDFSVKNWFWIFAIIWVWSTYAILAAKFNWWSPFYIIQETRHKHWPQYSGAFTHTVYQGMFSGIVAILSIYFSPLFVIPQIATLWLSHCSVAFVSSGACLALYLCRRFKRFWPLFAVVSIASILAYMRFDGTLSLKLSETSRMTYWTMLVKESGVLWFGNGLGSFESVVGVVGTGKFVNAHNFILQWYYETGIAGLGLVVAYGVYLVNLFRKTKFTNRIFTLSLCVGMFLFCSLWQPSMYVVEVAVPFLILLTLLERELKI